MNNILDPRAIIRPGIIHATYDHGCKNKQAKRVKQNIELQLSASMQ